MANVSIYYHKMSQNIEKMALPSGMRHFETPLKHIITRALS